VICDRCLTLASFPSKNRCPRSVPGSPRHLSFAHLIIEVRCNPAPPHPCNPPTLVLSRAGPAASRTHTCPPSPQTGRSGLYQGIRLSSYRRSELDRAEVLALQGCCLLRSTDYSTLLLYLQGPAPPRHLGLTLLLFASSHPQIHTDCPSGPLPVTPFPERESPLA
jgi:hypothetical protein